jgi:hypothetical protein
MNDAVTARQSADSAQRDASEANEQALVATSMASGATRGLSEVQDVLGTLDWMGRHGTYEQTTDTTVAQDKAYYAREGQQAPYTWRRVEVVGDENPSEEGWWELSVEQTLAAYTQQHLALMEDGLHVVPMSDGYHVVLGSDAMRVYGPTGDLVGKYGETMQLGSLYSAHIEAEGNRLSFFEPTYAYPRTSSGAIDWSDPTYVATGRFAGEVAYIAVEDGRSVFYMNRAIVVDELRFGRWAWRERDNGNLALKYIGV